MIEKLRTYYTKKGFMCTNGTYMGRTCLIVLSGKILKCFYEDGYDYYVGGSALADDGTSYQTRGLALP